MKVEIVDASLWHLFEVMEDMRGFERAQCEKLFGDKVRQEAAQILSRSLLAYAGLVDGRCVAVWGVTAATVMTEDGYLWLLGTRFLEEHPVAFLRHSYRNIQLLRTTFKHLYGMVLDELPCSVKWLTWLGFEVRPNEGGVRAFEMR